MASKIIYVLIAMAILNLSLLIFTCDEWNPETGECAGPLIASNSTTNSTIWGLISDPTTVGSGFWKNLFSSGWGLLAAIGVVGTVVLIGTTVFGKNIESTIYIAIGLGLVSMVYPAVKLWSLMNGLGMVGDTMTRSVLAIVIVSTIVLTFIFTILDWSRGRE